MQSPPASSPESASLDLWPVIADPAAVPACRDPAAAERWAARLGDLVSPALAADLLAPAADALGRPLPCGPVVRQSRLRGRFRRARYRQCLGEVAAAGFTVVALKGFASARLLYDDPDARVSGDLDVLVKHGDLRRLIDMLAARGYVFRPAPTGPWGFISDASLAPFVSADGTINLDLHVEPDCYPLARGLPAADMFRAARPSPEDHCLLPAHEHMLLLSISNAAKDKFGPPAAKQLVDALVLLRRHGAALDWDEVIARARRARLVRPMRVFLALLVALGLPRTALPPGLAARPGGLAAGEFRGLEAAWRSLFAGPRHLPTTLDLLRREWLLSAEPDVAVVRAWRRLRGLLRPRDGIPLAEG